MKKLLRNKKGFTMVELLVSATVLIILMSFVLASFRSGQYSSETSVVVKQIIQSIEEVRNFTLAGKVYQDGFPAGGYGVYFDQQNPNNVIPFIDINNNQVFDAGSGEVLTDRILANRNITLEAICVSTVSPLTDLPCTGSWQILTAPATITITFPQPGSVAINPSVTDARYVGMTFVHNITNKKAYIYLSLDTGAVVGKALGQQQ